MLAFAQIRGHDSPSGNQRKQQQNPEGHESLAVVGRHALRRKLDHLHQLALGGVEPRPQHVAQASVVGWRGNVINLRVTSCTAATAAAAAAAAIGVGLFCWGGVYERCSRKKDVHAVHTIDVERLFVNRVIWACGILHLRHRLSRQSGLVDNCTSTKDEAIAGHRVIYSNSLPTSNGRPSRRRAADRNDVARNLRK